MDTKSLIARAIEIVTFLFAAFGHFLLNLAPPEDGGSRVVIGIASVLTLAVLLYVSALARNSRAARFRRWWFVIAGLMLIVAIIALPWYRSTQLDYVFGFPESDSTETYVRGSEYTPQAEKYRESNPSATVQDLVADFGGATARERVWTAASIRQAAMRLTLQYLLVVLSLAIAIFGVTEGILGRTKTAPRKPPPASS